MRYVLNNKNVTIRICWPKMWQLVISKRLNCWLLLTGPVFYQLEEMA